jgi:uncharacterized protein (TIGR00255 family)
MPKSMTGYGKSERSDDRWTMVWEIRSVNGKQLGIRWKIPSFLFPQQAGWEAMLRGHAARGRVDVSLHLSAKRFEDLGVALNEPLAMAMLGSLRSLAADRGLPFEPDVSRILNIPALWQEKLQQPDAEMLAALSGSLEDALSDWDTSRALEGRALVKDVRERLDTLQGLLADLAERAPQVKEERFASLRERILEGLTSQGLALDENRLLQEVVYHTDKLDVSEELTRLASHLERIRAMLEHEGETGRKLDFLLQESFRETTTCGNKVQDLQASRLVVECKVELEKCREQVQNLE